ncbi:MAG: hypothetical protein RIB93_20540 [Coleofasciculus sp. D1-CHI-01]|uniref:hypothetical protein n=1 Tax=Coleofasciculus sp. D1-CHI-01 TaxID=3068482 RepID=UPI0032F3DF97
MQLIIILHLIKLVLALSLCGFLLYLLWKKRQQFIQKRADLKNGMNHCLVTYIEPTKFGDFPRFMSTGTIAALEYDDNHVRCLIQKPKVPLQTIEFASNTNVTLFHPKSSLIKFTTLIKFTPKPSYKTPVSPSSYYFAAINALGQTDQNKTKQLFAQIEPLFKTTGVKMVKQKRWINVFAYLFIIAAIGGIIIAIDSGSRAALYHGPTLVATTNQGEVVTASSHYLYQFDTQGQVQNRYPLEVLGIKNLTDIHALDPNQVLIGDWERGNIQRCQLDQNRCEPLPRFQSNLANSSPFQGAFKFVVDPQHDLIYATHTGEHRLLVLDQDGREIEHTRGKDLLLCYPNGITLSNEGKLVVADTNNFRLLTWSTNSQGLNLTPDQSIDMIQAPRPETSCIPIEQAPSQIPLVKRFNSVFDPVIEYDVNRDAIALNPARQGRVFPVFVQQDNQGFWWVLIGDKNLVREDLLRFDSNWQNPIRIDLPDSANNFNIAVGSDQLILTQPSRYRLLSVSLTDLTVQPFGDDRFEAMMQQEQKVKAKLWRFYLFSLFVPVFGLVGLGVLAIFDFQQQWTDMIKF